MQRKNKNVFVSCILCLALCLGLFVLNPSYVFAAVNGSGTLSDPFIIYDFDEVYSYLESKSFTPFTFTTDTTYINNIINNFDLSNFGVGSYNANPNQNLGVIFTPTSDSVLTFRFFIYGSTNTQHCMVSFMDSNNYSVTCNKYEELENGYAQDTANGVDIYNNDSYAIVPNGDIFNVRTYVNGETTDKYYKIYESEVYYTDISYTSSTTLNSGLTINNLDRVSIFEDNTEIDEGVNSGSTIGEVALGWIQNLGIWGDIAEATGLIVHDREDDLLYVVPDPSNYTYFSDHNTGTATMYNGWIDENNVYHRNMRTSEGWVNMPDYDSHYRHVAYKYNIRTGESSYNKNGLDGVMVHTDTSDIFLANGSSALEMYEAIQNSAHKTVDTGHYLVNNKSFSSNLQGTVLPYIQNNKLSDIYGLLNAIKGYEYVDLVSQKYANNSLSEILGYVIDAVDLLTDIKHYLGWGTFDNTHMCLEWIMLGLGVPFYDGSDYIINQSNMPIAEILTRNYLALTSRQNNGLIANTYEYDGDTVTNPYYFLSQYMNDNHINIGYIEQSVESMADEIVDGIGSILEHVFPESQPETNTTIINNITNVENDINISGENITKGYNLLNGLVSFFKIDLTDSLSFTDLISNNGNWDLWTEQAAENFGL